jgi:hypothetical protein
MSTRIGKEAEGRIAEIMFRDFSGSSREVFLRREMERYIPQFSKATDSEITDFIDYQRNVWLDGMRPSLQRRIACLNPTFVKSVDSIHVTQSGLLIYTRGSVKENGYRLILYNGPQEDTVIPDVSAVTRQFTPFDLRMFPELHGLFSGLPVMIGDSELVNRLYKHLAGFNRISARIPNNATYWPKRGSLGIDDNLLQEYFKIGRLFENKVPKEEFEVTLAFHGLFAIAHPDTWELGRQEQLESMVSLCNIPMDYQLIDEYLDRLAQFIDEKNLNARVVSRKVINGKQALREYVESNEAEGLEGTVVVQSAWGTEGLLVDFAKSIKIKTYETIDAAVLGVYLHKKDNGLNADNMKGMLLGLWDETHECYIPAFKVNLDSNGIQVKTADQRQRLLELNQNLVEILAKKGEDSDSVKTLYDVFIMEAKVKLGIYLGDRFDSDRIDLFFRGFPTGNKFIDLINRYRNSKEEYDSGELGNGKSSTKRDKWIHKYSDVLSVITRLRDENKRRYYDVTGYFGKLPKIKAASKRLIKPQLKLDMSEPLIIEAKVFDIKFGVNPYAAGFHSGSKDSFHLTNCYPERIRFDKLSTTDYGTITDIAKANTVK